jgi:hypothetical protein
MNICDMVEARDKACALLVEKFPKDAILVQRKMDERTQHPEARISSPDNSGAALWFRVKQNGFTVTSGLGATSQAWRDTVTEFLTPLYQFDANSLTEQ